MNLHMRHKKLNSLVNAHLQHITYGFVLVAHIQRLPVVALATARVTRDAHIRQETHLDALHPLPITIRTTTTRNIEGKAAGLIPTYARFRGLREQSTHVVPQTDIGGRTGPRGLADRGLVHFHDARKTIPTFNTLTTAPRGPGLPAPTHALLQVVKENVAHEGALSATAHTRHTHQPSQRNLGTNATQVMQRCTMKGQHVHRLRPRRSVRVHRMLQRLGEILPRDGCGVTLHLRESPLGNHATTIDTASRPQVYNVFSLPDGVFIVFNNDDGIAFLPQLLERLQQHTIVTRMQTNSGFIKNIANPAQIRSELRRQPDTSRLATTQRR